MSSRFGRHAHAYPRRLAFSALRAIALSGMNWSLGILVFVMGLTPFIVNIVSAGIVCYNVASFMILYRKWEAFGEHLSGANDPYFGCGAVETPFSWKIMYVTSFIASNCLIHCISQGYHRVCYHTLSNS